MVDRTTATKAVGAAAISIWMGTPMAVKVLCALMALDFLTGLLNAWVGRRIESEIGRRGLVGKAMMLIAVLALELFSRAVHIQLQLPPPLHDLSPGTWLACFFCFTELLSIIENTHSMIPYPTFLLSRLRKAGALFGLPSDEKEDRDA